jgi:hypothetical protein
MQWTDIAAGRSYRLKRNFEVRDERTGTLKTYFLKGAVLKVKKVLPEEDQVWVEGSPLPLPLAALQRAVDPVA